MDSVCVCECEDRKQMFRRGTTLEAQQMCRQTWEDGKKWMKKYKKNKNKRLFITKQNESQRPKLK